MKNDTLNKWDRLSTHNLKKRIRKFRKYTIYTVLGLLIIVGVQAMAGGIHAKASTIVAVCPESGCKVVEANYWGDYCTAFSKKCK